MGIGTENVNLKYQDRIFDGKGRGLRQFIKKCEFHCSIGHLFSDNRCGKVHSRISETKLKYDRKRRRNGKSRKETNEKLQEALEQK